MAVVEESYCLKEAKVGACLKVGRDVYEKVERPVLKER